MKLIQLTDEMLELPVTGGGSDIQNGATLKRGATPATNNGMLILHSGMSAGADIIGCIRELHDYSVTGDTNIAGTTFVKRRVQLTFGAPVYEVDYSLATADLITCTEAVNSTTMTVTSLEDDIDGAFVYVAEGTGIGQTNYLTASAAGSATLKAAFSTSLDTSSKFVKILPRFHKLFGFTSDGTKLASQAAAAGENGIILDNWIDSSKVGGGPVQLDPTKHANLTLLNRVVVGADLTGAARLRFSAYIVFKPSYNAG